MSGARNTMLFGAALAAATAGIAVDTYVHPVPKPAAAADSATPPVTPVAPCAAGAVQATAPCAAGAVQKSAPPPPPAKRADEATQKLAPPPPPLKKPVE